MISLAHEVGKVEARSAAGEGDRVGTLHPHPPLRGEISQKRER